MPFPDFFHGLLSEEVLRRLLRERPLPYQIVEVFQRRGFGYLKTKCPAWNKLAETTPVLLLTDLDRHPCAPGLLRGWLPHPRHPRFLFRVAVREVEAWLLAADQALGDFLKMRGQEKIPHPETLPDPKETLLGLAEKSRKREIRELLVRRDENGKLKQGPAYNSSLIDFVKKEWPVGAALSKCPSLARLVKALETLEKSSI